MDLFEDIETIRVIREVFFPKMEAFIAKIDEYDLDHVRVRECVRRFDEDLSVKANKIDLGKMESKLEESFISIH